MKIIYTLILCAFCVLSTTKKGSTQIEIRHDSTVNGIGYFTVTDSLARDRIDSGETLYAFSWNQNQLYTRPDGKVRIKGYNKNFDYNGYCFNTRKGYNKIPCGLNWCVWASLDRPFGNRPPLFMEDVENAIMLNEPCPKVNATLNITTGELFVEKEEYEFYKLFFPNYKIIVK